MEYRDIVEKYPENIVELLRHGYEKTNNERHLTRIQSVERNNYFIQKQFVELLGLLQSAESMLENIDVRDKTKLVAMAHENRVTIERCCNDPCNLDTFYYATGRPNCGSHCGRDKYCECEWQILNKLLLLMTIKNIPLDQWVLFELLRCRMCILESVGYKN